MGWRHALLLTKPACMQFLKAALIMLSCGMQPPSLHIVGAKACMCCAGCLRAAAGGIDTSTSPCCPMQPPCVGVMPQPHTGGAYQRSGCRRGVVRPPGHSERGLKACWVLFDGMPACPLEPRGAELLH